jgi:hypothetical protein
MGADLNINEVLKTRDEILDNLIRRIDSWDKTSESGVDIIEKNRVDIERLQSIEKSLEIKDLVYIDEEYIEKISFILQGERVILEKLSNKRIEVKRIINQISKKDKIKDNYIKQNQNSIFVDKDF